MLVISTAVESSLSCRQVCHLGRSHCSTAGFRSAGSWLFSLPILKDPGVGFIERQLDERDVVAVEAGGFVPDVALAKQTDDGHGVAEA